MKTKLVYALTITPESNYCEQALISIYTARYYNPEAIIILVIDDKTNNLIVGKRSEILNYITDKIVIKFDDDLSAMQRSRSIKTSLRKYIKGDFLFIDSDTLITESLKEIDNINQNIAAVLESHLEVPEFTSELYEKVEKYAANLKWNLSAEKHYFSSGVIYVKDSPVCHEFFNKWHNYWKEGCLNGVCIDQPSFAKANIELGYPVKEIDGRWNCVMYTHVEFVYTAIILHFCSFRNMSYIFGDRFLEKVKNEGVGINTFIMNSILNPHKTYLPFENILFNFKIRNYFKLITEVKITAKNIYYHLDKFYDDYIGKTRIEAYSKILFQKKLFLCGSILLVLYKFYRVKLNKKYKYVSNTCAINNI